MHDSMDGSAVGERERERERERARRELLLSNVSRGSEMHLIAGRLDRAGDLIAFAAVAKRPLRDLLRQSGAPEEQQFISLCVWGEVVQNFYDHTRSPVLRYSHKISGRQIAMTAVYRTPRFDTNPPAPDLYAEGGRGLWLMRIHSDPQFNFNGGDLYLKLVVAIPAV